MGQGLSCAVQPEINEELFKAVQNGELGTLEAMVEQDPSLLTLRTVGRRLSALHVAAANGRIEVLSMLLDRFGNPDVLNRHKQTPLMLAAMHGKVSCVEMLIEAGANILLFDTSYGRTCLHYSAYYGHTDCLRLILSAANSTQLAQSWGFSRFVNIRDGSGATPLHLAARHRRADCVRILLSSGALVCASSGGYSTPLHLAARGGSLDCVRELLAWGADRLQRDSTGRIPYMVAMKHKHEACAALLNPLAPEPLTWPSPLKFISELNPEAKALLENALIEANKKREKDILMDGSHSPLPLPYSAAIDDESEAGDAELCCICFEQSCTIEVQNCGHQMCAHCVLALCCHTKSNSTSNTVVKIPVCPFCRSSIIRLVVAERKVESGVDNDLSPTKPKKTRKSLGEGSSSFKSLSSLGGSFGRLGRSSGKVSAECNEEFDKL